MIKEVQSKMFVKHRFKLWEATKDYLLSLTPKFGYNGYGEFIFYRTYSRIKEDGKQENWADCIIRVTEGVFSIRKNWYLKTGVEWDEDSWQEYARGFAEYMFNMYWLPPGRGLWAMGSDFVYERGSMALYNCAYTDITDNFSDDFAWMMDSLMHGVGVGFGPDRNDNMELYTPRGSYDFIIPDTREGWVDSQRALLYSYQVPGQKKPRFIYDKVRPAGLPIKGFGGVSSGPEPLMYLHQETEKSCQMFRQTKEYDSVRFKADIGNKEGCCVVAGNVRRSAELLKGSVRDKIFLDLKNYEKYPEREEYGWMSNNAAVLEHDEDFLCLGEVARRVIERGKKLAA